MVQIDLSATSVKRIEEATFYNCKKVQKVLLPSVLQEIGKIAFSDCYVMNEFRVYKNVQYPSAVDLPSSLTTIGEGAFFNCKSLPYVGAPSSLKTIGDNAFQNCESLSNANLSGIKTVGKGAFNGCSKLTTANITSVTTLGDEVFSSCSSLTTVEGARSLVTIGDKAFYDCNQLAKFDWSSSITSIGKQAFCKCGKLPNITIGANVATIGEGAFSGCESATTITINTNNTKLKRIEKSTFNHAGFSELTIPASVEYIGKDALIVNRGITVTCLRKTTPTELEDEGAYWRYKEQNTLIVPSGTKAAYRASSHWTNYFGIIKEQ